MKKCKAKRKTFKTWENLTSIEDKMKIIFYTSFSLVSVIYEC